MSPRGEPEEEPECISTGSTYMLVRWEVKKRLELGCQLSQKERETKKSSDNENYG